MLLVDTAPNCTVTNQIQWYPDTITGITATKSAAQMGIDDWVCKYGKTSEFTAGYISLTNFDLDDAGDIFYNTFIRVNNTEGYSPLVEFGDSGGPWFVCTTAWGTTHGYPNDDSNDAIFMPIEFVGGLFVSVITSP
jgi:hypothetical protein